MHQRVKNKGPCKEKCGSSCTQLKEWENTFKKQQCLIKVKAWAEHEPQSFPEWESSSTVRGPWHWSTRALREGCPEDGAGGWVGWAGHFRILRVRWANCVWLPRTPLDCVKASSGWRIKKDMSEGNKRQQEREWRQGLGSRAPCRDAGERGAEGMEGRSVFLKGCCWITWRHQDSWPPEEKNSIRGQRQGLIAQSFCVIKFY